MKGGSVFQKGGGGTNFEQYVQSAFLTTLIVKGNIPCIPTAELTELSFQCTNRGYETDDLLAIAKSDLGEHRLLAQIKHNLIFSDSDSNSTFKEVIEAFWKDFNKKELFNKEKDRLVIIKSGLTQNERNHVRALLNWAKTHSSENDYLDEVKRIKEKEKYLDIFKNVLIQANNEQAISDKNLWQFVKCLELLEYDFLNEGSVDENYFINLIKLSRNGSSSSSEKDIWDGIYAIATKLNKDGGSITFDSISKDDIFKHFDIQKLAPFSNSLQKLRCDSELIIKPLKSTIGDLHLEKTELRSIISTSINDYALTIITGNPGVGKSAIMKEIIEKDFYESSVFIFRADQFNNPHLANVFAKQSISESIQDIISCVSLIPEKLIVIDSLEKLLEGDPENAFKQLIILLLEYPDIKIVATSRKYAVDLIIQKFGIEGDKYNKIEIPELNENELKLVSERFPKLVTVFKNQKLKALLKSPKYLDFVLMSLAKEEEDLSAISITDFKKKLWNNIIEDITTKKSGLSRKRSNAFLNIAIKRAKEMKLFVEPDDNLEEAVEALENDQVIFQEQGEYRFSPTHDILEDWALIKYVQSKYETFPAPKKLFDNIGNEPALRRAFRLWIEDNFVDHNEKNTELINSTLRDDSIEKYWADEVLIATFKSDNCTAFFEAFHAKLLENEGEFLNRCIHIIRTTCKESANSSSRLPIGSGWTEVILFINHNICQLEKYRLSIVNLLLDWEIQLLFEIEVKEPELHAVKHITIHFVNQVESGDEFWQKENISSKSEELISLLFSLARISKNEIQQLIERSFKALQDRENWRLNSFYRVVIQKSLSGLYSRKLVRELPELVVSTAWREWKLKLPEEPVGHSWSRTLRSDVLRSEECWGIAERRSFFPSGVYKTPIYNLLNFHPRIGLEFVTEFINYSVEFYVNAECEYKHQITEIEIELNDGTINKQWAARELWIAYRGLSVTHYLLECLLMSLEKYILDIANVKSDISRKNTQYIFNYLLQNSNNVAISGLLTSVAMAYPEEVGKEILPLLSVKEFYHWDLNRSLQENSALSPFDDEIPFAQKERYRSNKLPHRKRYTRGLTDFIIDYQFNIRTLNKEIHKVFDKLTKKASTEDMIWKKTLTEIDVRNHEIGDYDEQLGGFPIHPKYDKDVVEFIDSGKEEFESHNTSLIYSNKILKAYERKEEISFEFWSECFKYYSDENNQNKIYDRPVTLAVLGLKDFNNKLNPHQREWCLKTSVETTLMILRETINRDYNLNISYNPLEGEISIKAMHLVYPKLDLEEDRNIIIAMMIRMLIAPFSDHQIDYITEYVRNEFFKCLPDVAKRIWVGLIKYAEFRKSNPIIHYSQTEAEIKETNKKEQDFIELISSDSDLTLNVDEINFDSHEGYILARALIVTPYYLDDTSYHSFIKKLIPIINEDLRKEEDYSYNKTKESRQIHYDTKHDIEQFLAELLIIAELDLSKNILDLLLAPIYGDDYDVLSYGRDDLFKFVSNIPKYSIYMLDKIIANSTDENQCTSSIKKFWSIWEYFFTKIKESNKQYFTSILFLDVEWNRDSSHWRPLEKGKALFRKMISELGRNNSKSIINLFSTIGDKTFLPHGINWLTILLKENPREIINLISSAGERLIKRLFYNHILEIKNDKQLIDDYIWMLNNMIDLGSSEAYMFRENVITYKKST